MRWEETEDTGKNDKAREKVGKKWRWKKVEGVEEGRREEEGMEKKVTRKGMEKKGSELGGRQKAKGHNVLPHI